jgi:hypothetical protein
MKTLVVKFIFIFFCAIAFNGTAQTKVQTLDLMGKKYTVSTKFPDEIIGVYLYEGKGEPKIILEKDGFGYFQPHQTAPIKIKFWIDCDETGKLRKEVGGTGRYQYTLVVQYLDGNNGNYKVGNYDLMGVMIQPDMGRVAILGERYKPL